MLSLNPMPAASTSQWTDRVKCCKFLAFRKKFSGTSKTKSDLYGSEARSGCGLLGHSGKRSGGVASDCRTGISPALPPGRAWGIELNKVIWSQLPVDRRQGVCGSSWNPPQAERKLIVSTNLSSAARIGFHDNKNCDNSGLASDGSSIF